LEDLVRKPLRFRTEQQFVVLEDLVRKPLRFRTEQQLASDVLLQSAAIATPLLANLSAWLMAGLGAAFTLLLTNISSVAEYVHAYNIRWALIWFVASLLLGLIARLFSVSVMSGLNSNAIFSKQFSDAIGSAERFSFPAFIHFFYSGLLLPYKCVADRALAAAKGGDLMVSAKLTAKTSQAQALLVLSQIACTTISILVLATGIKV
jgi:hypothetical protein